MAEHRAKRDARRLLKNLSIQNDPKDVPGQRSLQNRDGIQSGGKDVLAGKYEELGRLLALQYLEKKALSSIKDMDIQIKNKSPKKKRTTRPKSGKKIENGRKSKSGRKGAKDHKNTPGYVFIKIPDGENFYEEDKGEREEQSTHYFHEALDIPTTSRKKKERRRRPKTAKKTKDSDGVYWQAQQERLAGSDSDSSQTGSSPSVSISIEESIEEVEYINRSTLGQLPAQMYSQTGEVFIKADENNQPVLVIQGEVEVTESVRMGSPELVEISEGEEDLNSSKKKVSFATEVDCSDETSEKLQDIPEEAEEEFYDGDEKPIHILLEEKILEDIIKSPRSENEKPGGSQNKKYKKRKTGTKGKSSRADGYYLNSSIDEDDKKEDVKSSFDKEDNLRHSCRNPSRSPSPRRSPRKSQSVPLSDHQLSSTENDDVKRWLRRKNSLLRKKKREEQRKEREKKMKEEEQMRQKIEKINQSKELVRDWIKQKRSEDDKKRKMEKKERKIKELDEEEKKKLSSGNLYSSGYRTHMQKGVKHLRGSTTDNDHSSDKANCENTKKRENGKKKSQKKKRRKSQVHPQDGGADIKSNTDNDDKNRMSYQEWLKRKMDTFRKNKISQNQGNVDPELEDLIPALAQKRIERATGVRGWRKEEKMDNVDQSVSESDLPESERGLKNPFVLPQTDDIDKKIKSLQRGRNKSRLSKKGLDSQQPMSRNFTARPSSGRPTSARDGPPKKRESLHETQTKKLNAIVKKYAWDDLMEEVSFVTSQEVEKGHTGSGDMSEDKDEGIFLTQALVS